MDQILMTSAAVEAARRSATLGYKDIMVHLDGTAEDENRIAHAESIAVRFQAHLTGLYTNTLPDIGLYAGEFGASVIGDISDEARRKGDAAYAGLTQRFERLGITSEVRKLENFPSLIDSDAATEARCADLFVASCPHGGGTFDQWEVLIETVMFDSGHGLYLVPRGVAPRQDQRTILVGWVDTREAARAVSEALPLLGLAAQIHLVSVHEVSRGPFGGAEALADIATHLHRRGIATTVSMLPDTGGTPASILLREAHRVSADLIVTGAYGHSRLREWVLGGTTYDLLRNSDLPLLMAH